MSTDVVIPKFEAVSVQYGAHHALSGIDLTLIPGTVTALMGPNGAGKTTLLRVAAGLERPTSGQVTLSSLGPVHTLERGQMARTIALMLRPPEIPFAWNVLELVLMGRSPHVSVGGFEGPEDVAHAREALARVDATSLAHRIYATLSAGEKQRVMLARALAQNTPILLLDEPTSHLDPRQALNTAHLLRELAAKGQTILSVMHDPNLAARAADRLVFLVEGTIAADGTPSDVLTPEVLQHVYGVGSRRVDGAYPAVVLEREARS
jgi:iron complex transport system ATP-binding protein